MKAIRFFTPLLLVLALLGNLLLLSACDDEGEPEKGLMPKPVSVTEVVLSPKETTLP